MPWVCQGGRACRFPEHREQATCMACKNRSARQSADGSAPPSTVGLASTLAELEDARNPAILALFGEATRPVRMVAGKRSPADAGSIAR